MVRPGDHSRKNRNTASSKFQKLIVISAIRREPVPTTPSTDIT